MHLKSFIAVATIAIGVTPVFADGHGQVVNDIWVPNESVPSGTMPTLVHSYEGHNFCPAGLQPVSVGDAINCGAPTAGAYVDHPGRVHHQASQTHGDMAMAVEGEKGVIYQ